MEPASNAQGLRPRTAGAVAFLSGFACMAVELTAVRLLAPSFGDSAYVWTNVIGVILLALALGAWAGGRLCERPQGAPLAGLLLVAAALTAFAPLFGPKLGAWLLPQDLPLDAAMPALVRGSLVATCILFGPAVWLLGALSPGLVAAVVRGGIPVGRVAGGISAAATTGSLLGTFAATHWLVPVFGCRATLWVAAMVMVVAAMLLRFQLRGAIVAALVGLSLTLQSGPLREVGSGQELIAERETRIQYLQVVRTPDSSSGARTELKINEGLDSFHSVAVEGTAFTNGGYYDWHALMPFLAGDGGRPAGLRALSIGDAAGTFRRIYDAVHPGAIVDAVELDAEAVALGDRYFGSRRANGRVFTSLDGRVFIERSQDRWHVIHVDAYGHQVYIPAHLASAEFFRAALARLESGGVVACNVGGLDLQDPVVCAIADTMANVFGSAHAMHVPDSRNVLLVARRDRPLDPTVLARVELGGERLGATDRAALLQLLVRAGVASAWRTFAAGAPSLVDDCPKLDRLLHESYVAHADERALTRLQGKEPVEAAEALAHEARTQSDPNQVLAAARRSSSASAYLRLLVGDARWQLRELHGAMAEYAAGIELGGDASILAQLRQRQTDLATELQPHAAAELIGARNGWMGIGCLTLLCVLGWGAGRYSTRSSVA